MKKYKELLNSNTPILFKNPDYKNQVITLDIETAPSEGAYYNPFQKGNIVWTTRYWFIMGWVVKYLGKNKTIAYTLDDFKEWKKAHCSKCKQLHDYEPAEYELLKKIYPILENAQTVIGYNSDRFDLKRLNAKFIKYGFEPLPQIKSIDMYKVHKRIAQGDQNSLSAVTKFYGMATKEETRKNLQKACIDNRKGAWKEMKKYNIQDVIITEKLYLKERGWAKTSPNMNLTLGTLTCCPTCGSEHITKRGHEYTKVYIYQAYHCLNCGRRFQGDRVDRGKPYK